MPDLESELKLRNKIINKIKNSNSTLNNFKNNLLNEMSNKTIVNKASENIDNIPGDTIHTPKVEKETHTISNMIPTNNAEPSYICDEKVKKTQRSSIDIDICDEILHKKSKKKHKSSHKKHKRRRSSERHDTIIIEDDDDDSGGNGVGDVRSKGGYHDRMYNSNNSKYLNMHRRESGKGGGHRSRRRKSRSMSRSRSRSRSRSPLIGRQSSRASNSEEHDDIRGNSRVKREVTEPGETVDVITIDEKPKEANTPPSNDKITDNIESSKPVISGISIGITKKSMDLISNTVPETGSKLSIADHDDDDDGGCGDYGDVGGDVGGEGDGASSSSEEESTQDKITRINKEKSFRTRDNQVTDKTSTKSSASRHRSDTRSQEYRSHSPHRSYRRSHRSRSQDSRSSRHTQYDRSGSKDSRSSRHNRRDRSRSHDDYSSRRRDRSRSRDEYRHRRSQHHRSQRSRSSEKGSSKRNYYHDKRSSPDTSSKRDNPTEGEGMGIDKAMLRKIAISRTLHKLETGQFDKTLDANSSAVEDLTSFCKRMQGDEGETEAGESSEDKLSHQIQDAEEKLRRRQAFGNTCKVIDAHSSNAPIVMNITNSRHIAILTPAEKLMKSSQLRKQFPVSTGGSHTKQLDEWVEVKPRNDDIIRKEDLKYGAKSCATGGTTRPHDTKDDKVSEVISQRLKAMKTLEDNPFDTQSLQTIQNTQNELQNWASTQKSKSERENFGRFTGARGGGGGATSTRSTPFNKHGGPQAWIQKVT